MTALPFPERFADEAALDEFLSRPGEAVIADLARVPGDIVVLGVGGKMGPTLAQMAKRADPSRQVIGVARFSEPGVRAQLEAAGVACIAADLLDRAAVAALPDAPNVVFMAGSKFGSTGSEALTWAMNVHVPALVAERYRGSRAVVFSTGCVYPFVDVNGAGADEATPPNPPPGEYANSCIGRERMFEFFGTAGRIFRLNYAIDMRYGVLHDIASKVFAGEPIELATGYANVIWQGDACGLALRCLARATAPLSPINISGRDRVSVRTLATAFGRHFGKEPVLVGTEAPESWLVDTRHMVELFGDPPVPLQRMIEWTADWIGRGMPSLGKPTHYEARDGTF